MRRAEAIGKQADQRLAQIDGALLMARARERIEELERELATSQQQRRVLREALEGVVQKRCGHFYSCVCALSRAQDALAATSPTSTEPKGGA
jgi:hypothetical protein